MAAVYRPFPEKLGGQSATSFVGNQGDLFYDPTTATLRVSDGSTSGGIVVGARYKGTGAFTNLGSSPAGTWTGAGITVTYGAVSGYGTYQFTFTMDHDYGDIASYLVLVQCHYHSDGAGKGDPLVFNLEKVNGTTFVGTASNPTAGTADDAKFDLFVFDA
tara:strand:+ start:124 stop:603 length:480 start_codon:yes stop_codon:yes gene_type:complete